MPNKQCEIVLQSFNSRNFGLFVAVLLSISWYGLFSPGCVWANDDGLWNALRSQGHFALIRHALAPGTGDPADFQIGNCETQRNLSNEGRAQAKRIGKRFRLNGINKARIYSSQWCRCRETAKLLGLGPVNDLPAINSFFRNFDLGAVLTQQLADWLNKQKLDQPLVLVTHQVNITAFTNIFPVSGEMVVIRRTDSGEFRVVGTIQTK